jgi:hypothetical protein
MPPVPWLPWRRRVAYTSAQEHPNLSEIVGILGKVPHLSDREIARLARGWHDNLFLATARDHALGLDSPLILDVLVAFDRIDVAFADELHADAYSETFPDSATDAVSDSASGSDSATAVRSQQVTIALKAIRDAVAAAYAKPILTRAEYIALMGPWRCTFAIDPTSGVLPPQRRGSGD